MTMSDRVALMMGGEVLQVAPPAGSTIDPPTCASPSSSAARRSMSCPEPCAPTGASTFPAVRSLSAAALLLIPPFRSACAPNIVLSPLIRQPAAFAARFVIARTSAPTSSCTLKPRASIASSPEAHRRSPMPCRPAPRSPCARGPSAHCCSIARAACYDHHDAAPGGRTDHAPFGPGARRGDRGLCAERAGHVLPARHPDPAHAGHVRAVLHRLAVRGANSALDRLGQLCPSRRRPRVLEVTRQHRSLCRRGGAPVSRNSVSALRC